MERIASRLSIALVALAAASLVGARAAADEGAACPFPASDAKELAGRDLVRAARTKLQSCVAACTGEEHAMCRAALDALHVPTIVVTVADSTEARAPRSDVRVVVDGEEAKPNVPIEVDPGPHLVQVQGARIGAEQRIVVGGGARDLAVTFETPKNAVEVEAEQGGPGAWPWVFIGTGFVGITMGMILAAVAQMKPVRDPDTDRFEPDETLRAAGVTSVILGIGFVGGGIIWHFLEKKPVAAKPTRTAIAPWIGAGSFGLAMERVF